MPFIIIICHCFSTCKLSNCLLLLIFCVVDFVTILCFRSTSVVAFVFPVLSGIVVSFYRVVLLITLIVVCVRCPLAPTMLDYYYTIRCQCRRRLECTRILRVSLLVSSPMLLMSMSMMMSSCPFLSSKSSLSTGKYCPSPSQSVKLTQSSVLFVVVLYTGIIISSLQLLSSSLLFELFAAVTTLVVVDLRYLLSV